jgi:hypothetical protein
MASPEFPAPFPTNRRSLRFYETGGATANFVDNQFAFEIPGKSPAEQGWSGTIQIRATGAALEFSFDGINVHGLVPSGSTHIYRHRYEGGIAVRGTGATFYIEAW